MDTTSLPVVTPEHLESLKAELLVEIRDLLHVSQANYSEDEAADRLGVSVCTLQRLRRRGQIGYVPVGGHYRYLGRQIDAFLEQHSKEPAKRGRAAAGARA